MTKCLKCGSEKVVAGAMSGLVSVSLKKKKYKWYQLNTMSFIPKPLICTECRHVELTISEEDLKEAIVAL